MGGYTNTIVEFLDIIINNDTYITEARSYIQSNYNIETDYDKTTSTMYIKTDDDNSRTLAENYLRETFSPEMLNIQL